MLAKNFISDRSAMQNTFGLPKSPFNKRKYHKGVHMQRNAFSTMYGQSLMSKRRLRAFFSNLKGKQLKSLVQSAIKTKNYKGYIIRNLESRLDTVLFRAGYVARMRQAGQLICHGQVYVNGRAIRSPSYKLKTGNIVSLCSSIIDKVIAPNVLRLSRKVPSHLFIDNKTYCIKINLDNLLVSEDDWKLSSEVKLSDVIRSYRV